MDQEIDVGCRFIRDTISSDISNNSSSIFEAELAKCLKRFYSGHWYPKEPSRASAYRCVIVRDGLLLDPLIRRAALVAGIDDGLILSALPEHLSVWIDPMDVSYRQHDRGPVVCLWRDGKYCDAQQTWQPATTSRREGTDVGRPFTRSSNRDNAMSINRQELASSGNWWTQQTAFSSLSVNPPVSFSLDNDSEHGDLSRSQFDGYPSSTDSPYSSRSNSPPSSGSPDMSEEEDIVPSRDDSLTLTGGSLQQQNGWTYPGLQHQQHQQRHQQQHQQQRGSRFPGKRSSLSRTAPVFAPRSAAVNNNSRHWHQHGVHSHANDRNLQARA